MLEEWAAGLIVGRWPGRIPPWARKQCIPETADGSDDRWQGSGGATRLRAAGLAILIAMSVSEQMPLADVKNRLSEVVDRLEREHGRVVITKHGHPAAVVMSVEDLESLEETLDIMDSAALLADIRDSLTELTSSSAEVLSKDQALRLIRGQ
jgi:antitoxin YefM